MNHTCPFCDQQLPRPNPFHQPLRFRIFAYLARHPGGAPTDELINYVYREHADGGPLSARSCLHTTVYSMNEVLAPLRLQIRATRGRGSIYRIINTREGGDAGTQRGAAGVDVAARARGSAAPAGR